MLHIQAYVYPHAHPQTSTSAFTPCTCMYCIYDLYIVSIATTSSKKAEMGTPLKQEKSQIAKPQILLPEIKSQMYFIVR